MLKDNIKPPSEKYVFFDFETKLVSNKHVVNYCIAHDFEGTENIFHSIVSYCSFICILIVCYWTNKDGWMDGFGKFHENPFSRSREQLSHIYALSLWRAEKAEK